MPSLFVAAAAACAKPIHFQNPRFVRCLVMGLALATLVKCTPRQTGDQLSGDAQPQSNSRITDSTSAGPVSEDSQASSLPAHRQEDFDCAFRLGRIYSATRNINFNIAGRKRGQIPAQNEVRAFLGSSKLLCPRQKGRNPTSYFVATSGPTPCDHPDVLAYEVGGNHRSYRHVLLKSGDVISVSEDEWAQVRHDSSYLPNASAILRAHSEMMNPIFWAEPEALDEGPSSDDSKENDAPR